MIFNWESLSTFSCSQVVLALVLALIITWAFSHWQRYAGTPPGPHGLPLVGYLPFLGKKLHLDFNRLAEIYGEVFSVVIGWRYVVVLNTYDVLKEAFVKDGNFYAGKPRDGIEAHFGDFKSLFVTDGLEWQEQRRFVLSTLRDFGFGKTKLEQFIQNEAQLIQNELLKWRNQPNNLRTMMIHAGANVVSSLIFDKSFSYKDKSLTGLLSVFDFDMNEFSPLKLADLYPILDYIPARWTGLDELKKIKKNFYDLVDKIVDEHERSYDENNIRDVIDVYLMKFKQLEKNPRLKAEPQNAVYTKDHMRANIVLLFSAGVETTANTLAWVFKLLAAYPKVQARVQIEIDDIIGRERKPTMADRNKMPFTEATLLEAHRFISLVPLTLWHRITDDTTFRGYRIPKNAFVLANLWNTHHDPAIWDEPMVFRPERFLSQEGKINHLRDYVVSFSVGKRNCLGESLARMEIFIFVTSLLQKLNFCPTPDGLPFVVTPDTFLPVARLKSYDVCVEPRL